MLSSLLRSLGLDLQQQTSHLQARAEAFRDHTIDRATRQVRHAGAVAGLTALGGLLALVTVGIALYALYRWAEPLHGEMTALGVTGLAAAVLAAILFTIAATSAKKKVVPEPVIVPAYVTPGPASPPPLTGTASHVSTLVPPLPPGAPLLDVVTHRVTSHAAAASDEAIKSATDLVRSGSRGALFGTLAVTVLAGLLIGRRKG